MCCAHTTWCEANQVQIRLWASYNKDGPIIKNKARLVALGPIDEDVTKSECNHQVCNPVPLSRLIIQVYSCNCRILI